MRRDNPMSELEGRLEALEVRVAYQDQVIEDLNQTVIAQWKLIDSLKRQFNELLDRVQEVVARRWGVTPEGLRSKARIKTLTVPRQIAMYLARDLLQMQLVEIGQAFGGRDHSTVIHSVDKVQRQMQRDRSFRDRIELARQELTAAQ